MEANTKISVKTVKEFMLGRHIALAGAVLAAVSTFLEWGIEPITGTSINGLEGGDPQIILICSFISAFFLLLKKFYKAAAILGIISLIISGVQFYEFSNPVEIDSATSFTPEIGIGIYLAIIGTLATAIGSALQIYKKH